MGKNISKSIPEISGPESETEVKNSNQSSSAADTGTDQEATINSLPSQSTTDVPDLSPADLATFQKRSVNLMVKVTELKVGIFARRAMVDQAREGLCYQ